MVEKVVHYKDLLKCNHGGKVDLNPTVERNTEIEEDLRIVTDKDLLEKVTISGCSLGCTKITAINTGLAKDFEIKDGAVPVLKNLSATTNKGCTVTWKGFEYNIDNAVSHLNSNAKPKSTGYCGRYVQNAIRAGGTNIPGANATDFGPVLEENGFQSVGQATPQKGDVVVFRGVPGHENGHTAMYNGSQWVSDFKQRNIIVSEAYRNSRYTIYRPVAKGNQAHAEPR
ncbi:Hypothetical protein A7982_09460 [Minicystis rosea]|nr:Hypothetical protein A7982_09460 [Minicystis rosea]